MIYTKRITKGLHEVWAVGGDRKIGAIIVNEDGEVMYETYEDVVSAYRLSEVNNLLKHFKED